MSQSTPSQIRLSRGHSTAIHSGFILLAVSCFLISPVSINLAYSQNTYSSGNEAYGGESIRLVVGRIDGTRRSRKNVVRFQRALSQLARIEIASTKDFTEQARGMRVDSILPEDSTSLTRLCDLLDIDAAVYAHVIREGDRNDLVVGVYAGENGQFVGEKVLKISRGRLTRGLWSAAARQLQPLISKAISTEAPSPGLAKRPPQARETIRINPRPTIKKRSRDLRRRIEEIPVGDTYAAVESERPTGSVGSMFTLFAGGAALSRSFLYTPSPESALFTDGGVDYELGFVPGLALEAELKPFVHSKGGLKGLGFRLGFEKVFFRTQQTVVNNDGSESSQILPSNHLHLSLDAEYGHSFASGAAFGGFFGVGYLNFTVDNNQEYQGATYTYLNIGLNGLIPLGTPLFGLEVRGSVLPFATLGSSVEEVGDSATIFGYRAYLGFVSRLDSGLAFRVGADYTHFASEISGEGRDGRVGQSASDRFIGARFMIGYQF